MLHRPRILSIEYAHTAPAATLGELLTDSAHNGTYSAEWPELMTASVASFKSHTLPLRVWELIPLAAGIAFDLRATEDYREAAVSLNVLMSSAERSNCPVFAAISDLHRKPGLTWGDMLCFLWAFNPAEQSGATVWIDADLDVMQWRSSQMSKYAKRTDGCAQMREFHERVGAFHYATREPYAVRSRVALGRNGNVSR